MGRARQQMHCAWVGGSNGWDERRGSRPAGSARPEQLSAPARSLLSQLTEDQRFMLRFACGKSYDIHAATMPGRIPGTVNVLFQAAILDSDPPAVITPGGNVEASRHSLPVDAVRISRADVDVYERVSG